MNDQELLELLEDLESDRVERKASVTDGNKIRQAICAFANDLPNYRQPGILFVGVNDDGTCANLPITTQLLEQLGGIRSEGKILPFPRLQVTKRTLKGCELVVVIVEASDSPPVRFDGRTWIRVGPRRAVATVEEERRLNEKRRARDLPFDLQPLPSASFNDFDGEAFEQYLSAALAPDILEENQRSRHQQLASLRFTTPEPESCPTVVGIMAAGKDPKQFIPGFYIQFVRFNGIDMTDPISDQKIIRGSLLYLLRYIDEILQANIETGLEIITRAVDTPQPDYPIAALQQLSRNAVMHRSYENTHAPIRISWFDDRIEIQNPGGLYGQVNEENFGKGGITDYRNPHLAEAMRNLGYVQRFGIGISIAQKELKKNGNPPAEFRLDDTSFMVTVRRS